MGELETFVKTQGKDMTMLKLRTLIAASVIAIGTWGVSQSGAHAAGAGAITFTQTDHNVTSVQFLNPNPCTGALGTLTTTVNDVFHFTMLTNGTGWFTFTVTGSFSFIPIDPTQPSYTGHFQDWGNQNFNLKNSNSTFTFNVHGTGSDGSTLAYHENGHFSVSATGVTIFFDNIRCG
jgi:hypothetical protein